MLIDNLDMLERVVYQIKAMLKEPNQENFEPLKLQTVERINASQQELNPSQKITKEEVQEGEPHIQPAAEVPAEPEPTENTEVKEWLFINKLMSKLLTNTGAFFAGVAAVQIILYPKLLAY